ncbi:DUF3467 domain-containing protein [Allorhodopirellula solitaria]|uniref:DUF3467 domain-containing protein n=1 Tax=Allorhodopirellula solitaria TaxID=2527987 RepID=A0A5C5X2M5_9BACT|nr:DUF3467 domain-containing protein [Allorhodopirellula solitaria]TWT56413.1 hypothetical protein CA85_42260 [Allorhodopirellula solitaria]
MADDNKNESEENEAATATATAESSSPAAKAQTPPQQPVQVQVEDQNALATYANFCRVTGSPEELIIDFGLNPQPIGVPKEPIQVKQRIIVNFFTAKRLLAALQMSVARHESVFGVLETDINKRVRPGLQQQQQPKS